MGVAAAVGVLMLCVWGIAAMLRRHGKDAVAGRQTIGRVPLKHRRW